MAFYGLSSIAGDTPADRLPILPHKETVLETFQAAIPFFADFANYDERLLASYLSLLIQGQVSGRAAFPRCTMTRKINRHNLLYVR
jgi:hypothetical protein